MLLPLLGCGFNGADDRCQCLADILLVCAESNPPSVLATFRFAAYLSLVQVLRLCLAFLRAGRLLSLRSWEPQGLPSQCPMLDRFLLRCQPSPTIHLRIALLYGGRSFLCRGSVRASAHTACPARGPVICVSLDPFLVPALMMLLLMMVAAAAIWCRRVPPCAQAAAPASMVIL